MAVPSRLSLSISPKVCALLLRDVLQQPYPAAV